MRGGYNKIILPQTERFSKDPTSAARADQFSNFRGTGILPVAGKHGQDARATMNGVT
jgi:hypothetical protein